MKKNSKIIALLLLLSAMAAASCSDKSSFGGTRAAESNAPEHSGSGEVVVLTVDFTSNMFLGGYTVAAGNLDGSIDLKAEYNSPLDFGDVAIFEKNSGEKLFAGTIIWMGKGKRTYPEVIMEPSEFGFSERATPSPELIYFDYTSWLSGDEFDEETLSAVWGAVSNLDVVRNVTGGKVYMSLYQPSVGAGDPADWYWLVFIGT